MPQQERFIDFNNIDYLKNHSNTDIGEVWKKLINYLNNEIEEEDNLYHYQKGYLLQQPGTFADIIEKIDLPLTFYSDIKNNMVESLFPIINLPIQIENITDMSINNWYNSPWNNSVAKLMLDYYFALDTIGAKIYETDSLYINEDGTIDIEKTRGAIKINNSNIKMRISDIKDADAGHSFDRENNFWEFINYITNFNLIITNVEYDDNGIQKKEYFDQPLILSYDRENYLKNYPEQYEEIYFKEKEKGFCREDIINCLNGTSLYGWRIDDVKNFISTSHAVITSGAGGDAQEFILNKKGNYYLRGAYEENIVKLKHLIEDFLWVIPWYNINGKTYRLVREDDINLSAIYLGYTDDREIKNQGKYFLDFTRKYNNEEDENKWMRLLMPQYKRRVEIEDLNRNFWVIGQTISALMAYLFDPAGPYPRMIGKLLNEIMQLWENILFMWAELAAQNIKQPDTITKVVYISPNNLSDYLSYDDFDFYDIWEKYNFQRAILSYKFSPEEIVPIVTVINMIPTMRRHTPDDRTGNNNKFEEVIINYLRNYRKKFANKNVNLIPVVRLDNYEENNYSRIICPGIYRYFINNEELLKKAQQEQWDMPQGELINGVFRTDTDAMGNVDPRILNCYKESFLGIIDSSDGSYGYYKYDISTDGFEKVIAGIYEKASEDGYGGVNYLVLSDQVKTANLEKIYGLIKPIIKVAGYGDANLFLGAESVEIEIEAYDLAKYFIETKNEIDNDGFIKISDYIIYRQHYSEVPNAATKTPINKSIDRDFLYSTGISGTNFPIKISNNIEGVFGYYLGEILSKKKDSAPLNFNVIRLNQRELQPTYLDYDLYQQNYGHSPEDYPEIVQDEEDDKISLINLLKNIYLRWRYNNENDFWSKVKDENEGLWAPDQAIRVGYDKSGDNLTPAIKKRSEVKESNVDDNSPYVWRINETGVFDEETWKKDAYNNVDDLVVNESLREDMTESTILFVDGGRITNWTVPEERDAKGQNIIAKDGLVHHRYPTSSPKRITAGAAVRIPIEDGDAQYGYYPLHTDPTNVDAGWGQIGITLGTEQIWRWVNLVNGEVVPSSIYNDTLKRRLTAENNLNGNETFFSEYRSYKLMYKKNNELFPRFGLTTSSSGSGTDNYFVLRREGATEFDETNWLIEKVSSAYSKGLCYYKWRRDSTPDKQGIELLATSFKENDDRTSDGEIYADGSTKIYTSINSCESNLWEYYKHVYQKYIYTELNKMTEADLENLTLEDAYKRFNLRKKIFGWFRIIFVDNQGNETGEIKNFYMPYNKPVDCSNLYSTTNENDDISEINYNSTEIKEIIKIMRSGYTFGGVVKNGKAADTSTLTYEQLKEAVHYFEGSYSYDEKLKNCKFMGSFCQVFSGSINMPDTIKDNREITTRLYYEDRIMTFHKGNREVIQKDFIYNNQSKENNIRLEYVKTMEAWLKMFPNVWYDPDESTMLRKIAEIIVPQDNDFDTSEYTFTLTKPNSASPDSAVVLTFNDQIFLTASYQLFTKIWIFGPKNENNKYVYARRGIYRYPFDVLLNINEDTALNRAAIEQLGQWGDEYYGAWPARPVNRMTNNAHNWKDDYEILGYDIDELRDGYEVISQTDDRNIEMYKSRFTKKLEETFIEAFHDSGLEARIDELDTEIWDYPRGG